MLKMVFLWSNVMTKTFEKELISYLRKHLRVKCGIRVNPEHSETDVALYDPCARYSRLGVTAAEMDAGALAGVSGLHFHCLCEAGAEPLGLVL